MGRWGEGLPSTVASVARPASGHAWNSDVSTPAQRQRLVSLARHTAANVAGAVIPLAVSLLTVPLYLRLVGTERYGALAIIWVLLNYFAFFDFGLGRAVAQRLSLANPKLSPLDASRLVWTASISTFAGSIAGGLILWRVAAWHMGSNVEMSSSLAQEVARAIGWLPLILPVVLLTSILQGCLQARLKFVELNAIQSVTAIAAQVLPLLIAMTGRIELQILVPTVFLPRMVGAVFMALLVRRHLPLGPAAFNWTQLKDLLSYGGWVSLTSIFGPLLVVLDRVVISAIHGARFVTYYTVPYDLVTKLSIVSGGLSSAIFPRLAATADPAALAERSTETLMWVMTPLVVSGILFVQPFLEIWVGAELARLSGPVAKIILVGVWVNSLVIPHGARMLATRNPRDIVLIYLAQLPVYVACLWYGIAVWGVTGAAIAWTARVLLNTTMILTLAGAFKRTTQSVVAQAGLILFSILITYVLDVFSMTWWLGALAVIGASTFMSRSVLAIALKPLIAMVRS